MPAKMIAPLVPESSATERCGNASDMTRTIRHATLAPVSTWLLWLVGGSPSTSEPGGMSTWNGRIAPAFIGWRGSSTTFGPTIARAASCQPVEHEPSVCGSVPEKSISASAPRTRTSTLMRTVSVLMPSSSRKISSW